MLPPKLGIISKIYRQVKRKQRTGTMSVVGYHLCNKERGEKCTHVFNCLCTKKNFRKNIYEINILIHTSEKGK